MDSIFLFSIRDPLLVKLFLWITLLGKSEVVVLCVVAASAILWLLRKRQEIFGLWVSVAGSAAFVFIGKIIFNRTRPSNAVYLETSASFPSGHAAAAVAFYGFLVYLFLRNIKNRKYRVMAVISGLMVILAVGFSRIYLGVHYLSDVLGGYFLGLLWLAAGIIFSEYKNFSKKDGENAN